MVAATVLDDPPDSTELVKRTIEILDAAVGMPGCWVSCAGQELKLSDRFASSSGTEAVPQAHCGTTQPVIVFDRTHRVRLEQPAVIALYHHGATTMRVILGPHPKGR